MIQEFFMVRKKKLLILIPALLLIPVLLGMVPLKKAHKLAQGGPFSQSSQGCSCNNCPAHSLISHNHFDALTINSTPAHQVLLYSQRVLYAAPESIFSNIHFSSSIPLRC